MPLVGPCWGASYCLLTPHCTSTHALEWRSWQRVLTRPSQGLAWGYPGGSVLKQVATNSVTKLSLGINYSVIFAQNEAAAFVPLTLCWGAPGGAQGSAAPALCSTKEVAWPGTSQEPPCTACSTCSAYTAPLATATRRNALQTAADLRTRLPTSPSDLGRVLEYEMCTAAAHRACPLTQPATWLPSTGARLAATPFKPNSFPGAVSRGWVGETSGWVGWGVGGPPSAAPATCRPLTSTASSCRPAPAVQPANSKGS